MSNPATLQVSFEKGMRREVSRHMLPKDAAWDLRDVVLGGAGLQERGGWTHASPDLSTIKATASYVVSGLVAPFSAGDQNLCVDEDGELYKITSSTVASDLGALGFPARIGRYYRELVIFSDYWGNAYPKKYNGSTISALAGSPPLAKFSCVFNDWFVLGGTSALPNRVYFSAAGNPESWDTSAAWIDADHKIKGLVTVNRAILIFTDHGIERLRGSIAPPGSDLTHDTLAVSQAPYITSIVQSGGYVMWANRDGVFMTDGASISDLTLDCGLKRYWQAIATAGEETSYAGILSDRYYVITMAESAYVIDIPMRRAWRWSNIPARNFWSSGPYLYFGRSDAPYVGELSSTLEKTAAVKNDANGTPVTSLIETLYYEGPTGLKTWRAVYPSYYLADAASDNPTFQLSYILSPESTSYTNVGSAQAETTEKTRSRVEVNKKSSGIALRLTRSNAAADFRFYGMDADVFGMERSRTS